MTTCRKEFDLRLGVFYLILFNICLLAADITVVNIVQEIEDQAVARK
jgi:hypothetical protein